LNNLNKKVMLTDAGEVLLPHAQHILEEMQGQSQKMVTNT
jgi:DNA-binding transcriptional LysR family regulator